MNINMDGNIRILKTSQCNSLSGKSTLSYQIGCDTDSTIHIRLTENSGAGMFSKAWTPLTPLLSSEDKMVTSGSLNPLFAGKSVNSAGFLLAVLIHEGLIQIVGEKPRTYERRDPKEFMDAIQAIGSQADISIKGYRPFNYSKILLSFL